MHDKKKVSQDSFDRQASTYDFDINGKHARTQYNYLLNKLETLSYHSLLDLGCGTGELLKQIVNQSGEKELYGLDISKNMLKIAEEKLAGVVTLVQGDSEYLPFSEGQFDVILCNDSFHHYPNPDKVVKEVYRVLKKGGIFILCDYWKPYLQRSLMNFFMHYNDDGDVKIYSQNEIRTFLNNTGFTNVFWNQIGSSSYAVRGTK